MKNNKILLLTICIFIGGCINELTAQNIMKIHDINAYVNEVITVEIEIINDAEFVGFNLDIPLPEGFNYVDGTSQLFRGTNHEFGFNQTSENILKIIAFSVTNDKFEGDKGVIFSFDLQVPNLPGNYPLEIVEAIIANIHAENILNEAIDGMIFLEEDMQPNSENIIKVRDATTSVNNTFTIELEIINEDEFVGFNADILLPSGFTYIAGSAQLHRNDGHFFNFAIIEHNVARMLSASIPTKPFPGNDGVIVSFDLQTPGEEGVFSFCVTDAVIADEDGVNIMTGDICGEITIDESSTVTFSANNYLGQSINDAIITLGGLEKPAGDYVFENIQQGTHQYTVEKDCYLIAEDFVVVSGDIQVNVLLQNVLGDANNDGFVNVSDVVIIANYFMGQSPDPFCFINADVNGDGMINVSDVVGATNIFMGGKISPHQGLKSEQASAYLFQDGIYLDSDGTLTAMQLEIKGYKLEQLSMALNLPTHQLIYRVVDNKLIAMVFSISNATIPEGKVRIIDFEPDENMLQWGEVLVANLNAELVDVETRTGEATDVHEIEGIENIQVYPNPAKDVLWVEFVNNSDKPVMLSLMNIYGQEVQNQTINYHGFVRVSINLGSLTAGIYLLRLEFICSSVLLKINLKY